jgi:c-di-GMP-binding flagellar brake protein YcgR
MDARLTLLDAPASTDDNCYIDTPLGVASVLRAVAAAGTRTAAYIDTGETFVHTTLLAVEAKPPALLFERGPDETLNARLLHADKVTFVTSDQGVPVQFTVGTPVAATIPGTNAFRVSMPVRVLRLQRRMYYRLPGEPIQGPLTCEIPCGSAEAITVVKPVVLDLSCGGLAAIVPAGAPLLETGSRNVCTLELPDIGRIEATIEVRASSEAMLPGGRLGRRYGLEFVDLNNKNVALIQRFILEQQRARKRVAA